MHLGNVCLAILDSRTHVDGVKSCNNNKKEVFDYYILKNGDFIHGKEM